MREIEIIVTGINYLNELVAKREIVFAAQEEDISETIHKALQEFDRRGDSFKYIYNVSITYHVSLD